VCFEVEKNLPALRLEILNVMSLVQDHVIPLFSTKNGMVSNCYLVRCYADVEAVEFRPTFTFLFALFGGAEVGHYLEGRTPTLEFDLPVHQNCSGYYYKVRAPYSLLYC
jgi:hypothetical protein